MKNYKEQSIYEYCYNEISFNHMVKIILTLINRIKSFIYIFFVSNDFTIFDFFDRNLFLNK